MPTLVIQIPCYNEEETLPIVLAGLPRQLPGVDRIEWLVIDDGSTDRTIEVARAHGVDHIIRLKVNRGLARAFMAGLDYCVKMGADIIVNTDADNQYNSDDIPLLIGPILRNEAEIVIGERPISTIEHWSPVKKFLQRLGSWVVRIASGTNIPDAPSGFRAFSREAAMRLNVFDTYTYTLETIIQAGRKNMPITSVRIRTNGDTRPSRLVKDIPTYVQRSLFTIVRIFMTYRPFRFFASIGMVGIFVGVIPILRFLYYYVQGQGDGHIQSLIFAAIFIAVGVVMIAVGLLAEIIAVNRQMLEDIRWRIREMDHQYHGRMLAERKLHLEEEARRAKRQQEVEPLYTQNPPADIEEGPVDQRAPIEEVYHQH